MVGSNFSDHSLYYRLSFIKYSTMKTTSLLLLIALTAGCDDSQSLRESEVPEGVVAALHEGFPQVKDYKWYAEGGNYEAEYTIHQMEAALSFTPGGELIESEMEVAPEELPQSIASYIAKNFEGAAVKEATVITNATGIKTYEAEVQGRELLFNADGQLLREGDD